MSGMYTHCLIKSYKEAETWFSHARNKEKGRPFKKWGLVTRHHEIGNAQLPYYDILVWKTPVLRLTPDNKLTFLIGPEEGREISPTLSAGLCKLVPVNWGRAGKLRYRILPTQNLNEPWWLAQKKAPELYNGLQLDLTTGTFTNAKPDMIKRIDSQARKVWLRALRNFKSDMKLRAKIGVFDGIATRMSAAKKFTDRMPDWRREEWAKLLYECIRDREYPNRLLGGIVLTMHRIGWDVTFAQLPMTRKIKNTLDYIIDCNRVDLRTRFGVFSDEVESNE